MPRPLLRVLPRLLAALALVWAGLYVARSYLAIGLVTIGVGAVSVVLVWRKWVAERTATLAKDSHTSAREIDYVVWMFLGVPMIFIILLVIQVITSR